MEYSAGASATEDSSGTIHWSQMTKMQWLPAMLMTLAGLGFRKNNCEQTVATMGQKLTHMTL